MFGHRRRLRRLATQTLLAWLFALACGMVNACVVAPEQPHALRSSGHEHHHAAQAQQHEAAAGPLAHEGQASHAGKPACAKFCDDESAGVPTLKHRIDPPSAVWLALPPTDWLTVAAADEPVGEHHAAAELALARVPIPIAFLRLTL